MAQGRAVLATNGIKLARKKPKKRVEAINATVASPPAALPIAA